MDLKLLIHIGLKCLRHSSYCLCLLTGRLLKCLLKLLLSLGQLLNHLHQHLLIACLWTSLLLLVHLASTVDKLACTEAVRQLPLLLLMLDLRTPAPLPCKNNLGSYTCNRTVSAQARSFTQVILSLVKHLKSTEMAAAYTNTYRHVSTCIQLYTYLVNFY